MVSKSSLKLTVKYLGQYFLDVEEQEANIIISEAEMMIQRVTESKQRRWRLIVRRAQNKIRQSNTHIRRIQEVRDEIMMRGHPRMRFGLIPDHFCEHRDCKSTNVEIEKVHGKPLTLCVEHGSEYSDELTTISELDMAEWANDHLNRLSARKWPRTATEMTNDEDN